MSVYSIDIGQYRTKGARIFTGRERGQEVREKSRVDEVSESYDTVEVIIPEDIITINPSFLEEYFRKTVLRLGRSKFFEKFVFKCQGKYLIQPNLETAVERILRKNSALE